MRFSSAIRNVERNQSCASTAHSPSPAKSLNSSTVYTSLTRAYLFVQSSTKSLDMGGSPQITPLALIKRVWERIAPLQLAERSWDNVSFISIVHILLTLS